jgi:thiol-disulfide isomerase/thioredoxin
MRFLLLMMMTLSSLVMFNFKPAAAEMIAKSEMSGPKIVATFHADWCSGCKVLAPKMKEAKQALGLEDTNLVFVTFDLTDDATKRQAALLADALGIKDIYEAHAPKTGMVLFIDQKTKEVQHKIHYKSSVEELEAAMHGM